MPIPLEQPIEQPAIVAKEITWFDIDLKAMVARVRLSFVNAKGELLDISEGYEVSLVDENGSRFTPEEYATVKSALYRLLSQDDHIPPEVV